jgi:hypothetical protein
MQFFSGAAETRAVHDLKKGAHDLGIHDPAQSVESLFEFKNIATNS